MCARPGKSIFVAGWPWLVRLERHTLIADGRVRAFHTGALPITRRFR
jgi:hypothetical protein